MKGILRVLDRIDQLKQIKDNKIQPYYVRAKAACQIETLEWVLE